MCNRGKRNAAPRKTAEKSNLQEATMGDSFVYDMIIEQKERKGKRHIATQNDKEI